MDRPRRDEATGRRESRWSATVGSSREQAVRIPLTRCCTAGTTIGARSARHAAPPTMGDWMHTGTAANGARDRGTSLPVTLARTPVVAASVDVGSNSVHLLAAVVAGH